MMKHSRSRVLIMLLATLVLFIMPSLAYDPDLSYNAVMYSAASYCKISDVLKWDCGRPCMMRRGVKHIVGISHKEFNVFGFVAYNENDKELIVSFRGTNGVDPKNWYMNMQGDRVQYEDVAGAQVHSGKSMF